MARTLRTFIAVESSPEVHTKAQQLIKELSATPAKVKWVEPHNLHLTLKFLGDVEMLEMPNICEALTVAAANIAPFDLESFGAGAFPSLHSPRTVWIGARSGSDEMVDLHDRIEQALEPFGFRREQRRFRPHLTIGRVRNSPDGIEELAERLAARREFVGGSTDVSEIVLFSSELGREGPTYEVLHTAPLAGLD
jgi:2'-5' RNA ligase